MLTTYNENKTELKELFKEIFHESDSFTDIIFEKKLSKSDIFTIKENGKILAFAYGIPCFYKTDDTLKNCIYIYGVGVRKEYRGKGYAKKIMDNISDFYKDKSIDFLYLVPATKELFFMYEKMGFDTVISLTSREYDLSTLKSVEYEVKDGDLKEDYKNFVKNKNNVILRSDNDNDILLSYLTYKKANNSGFLYYKENDTAIVRESFIFSENNLFEFLSYLKVQGIKKAKITQEKGDKTPYALVKKYKEINLKNIYTTVNFD